MTLDKIKAAKRIFACGGGGSIYNLVHILFIRERCATHCSGMYIRRALFIYIRFQYVLYLMFIFVLLFRIKLDINF